MNFDDIFKALDSNMINPKIELDEKMINPKIELDEKMINPKIELDEKMINPKIQLNKPSKVSDFREKKQIQETKVQTKSEKQVQETKVQTKPEKQVQETKVQTKPEKQVQETKVQTKPEKLVQETKVQTKQTLSFIFGGICISFCLLLITIFFVSTWTCKSSNQSQCRNVETIDKDVVQYLGFQKKF